MVSTINERIQVESKEIKNGVHTCGTLVTIYKRLGGLYRFILKYDYGLQYRDFLRVRLDPGSATRFEKRSPRNLTIFWRESSVLVV